MGLEKDKAIIEKIETYIVDLPTIRPHQLSMATMKKQSMVILRLFCSDGIEGFGEATTIGGLSYGEESPEGIRVALESYLIPTAKGMNATNPNAIIAAIDKVVRGNRLAKSALETALLDAQARRLNISFADLLGGSVHAKLPVLWTLASGETQRDIEEAEKLLAEKRHRTFKLKIGSKAPELDIAHVIAIKKALGDRAQVTVDINQAWNEGTAKKGLAAFEEARIDLIEQPLAKENFEGLARLTQMFKIPIMADEAVSTPQEALRLAEIKGADVIALKIAKSGGPRKVLKTAAVAEAGHIALYGGTLLEGSIGTIASAHAFSTLTHLEWGTELFGPLLLTDDIITKPLTYQEGFLELPRGPGLGIELDLVKLKHYARRN